MTIPGVEHGLPLPNRISEPQGDASSADICMGGASTVRVLCIYRRSRKPWSGESMGHRASHTTLSRFSFEARFLEDGGIASSGNGARVTSMTTTHSTSRPLMPLRLLCKHILHVPQGVGRATARCGRLHVFCVTNPWAQKNDGAAAVMHCRDLGSNRGPSHLQTDALPAELSWHENGVPSVTIGAGKKAAPEATAACLKIQLHPAPFPIHAAWPHQESNMGCRSHNERPNH